MFLSPVSRLGSGLASISLYGGLLLFSGFLLYDTQHVIRRAESHPPPNFYLPTNKGFQNPEALKPFDPINNSIRILLDAVNIFVRIAVMLSGGGQRYTVSAKCFKSNLSPLAPPIQAPSL
ncbi:unnamed protein product [Schistosoma mattheei]|uniref:Uncharacterized protein n=1 Tax=Schistosoma mattheei TaxID=31246 RepID=A0A183P708_9TREM|nr:unnamed protein product [Schistosoma mattheei]